MLDIVLLACLAVPVVLILFLKTNTAVVFFSLCAGSVLVNYGAVSVLTFADSFSANPSAGLDGVIRVGLLLLPAVFSTLLLRKSFPTSKIVLFAPPAVAVGLTGLLLAVPVLPGGIQHNVMQSNVWDQVNKFRDIIILGSFAVSLLALWAGKAKIHKGKHSK